ncbi:hypothetical protein CSQ96_05770 [Janthinobacterium sp. BJB412]|nr:hypothetical protein CSQ96_05770 [Janthinobacterium sp. BJB412]
MRRKQIRLALEAAAKLGPHTEFVIAGSLSVLGFIALPPKMMSMSIDIDFFPLRDQTHVQEIAEVLGEDSAFHEVNGYYLDPITSDILVLPPGWMDRLVPLRLGSVRAYFLDVNDTAISKYARSAENDFRWIDAGLEAGILDLDKIEARAQFGLEYPGDEDRRKVRNGIAAHRAALKAGSGLRRDLLHFLRSRPDDRIENTIDDEHSYSGTVQFVSDDRVVQEVEPGVLVIHDAAEWRLVPVVGDGYTVGYADGVSSVSANDSNGP